MTARRIFPLVLLAVLALFLWAAWWLAQYFLPGPIASSGGIYFPRRVILPVPQFFQADARWAATLLGAGPSTMGDAGCAVTSAAMVLSSYGVDVDPGRLDAFLTKLPGGFTPQGWIYWEKAAEFDPRFTARLLPHYEAKPSYFLVDWNLLHGNPVIARVQLPGVTHFVVICGKSGYDYLIRDPATGGQQGVYPLRQIVAGMDAIRFYRKP